MYKSAYLTWQITSRYQETLQLVNFIVFFFSEHLFLNCFVWTLCSYFSFLLNSLFVIENFLLFVAICLSMSFILHFLLGSSHHLAADKIILQVVSRFLILFPNLLLNFSSLKDLSLFGLFISYVYHHKWYFKNLHFCLLLVNYSLFIDNNQHRLKLFKSKFYFMLLYFQSYHYSFKFQQIILI